MQLLGGDETALLVERAPDGILLSRSALLTNL